MSKTTASFTLFRPLCFTLAMGSMLLSACGAAPEETLTPNAMSSDRSVKALTGAGGAPLVPKVLKGTYGPNCKLHKGETWDLNLNDPLDKSLELALNDTFVSCPLTLTAISVQVGSTVQDHPVVPPIVLSTSYAANPSAADPPGSGSLAFYTNARLSGLAGAVYTNNFVIAMIYSDDAVACKESAPPAIYAKVTATATGTPVTPPNYVMDFDALQLVVDANKVVQSSSTGNINLKLPGTAPQPGEEWRIFAESTLCCQSYSFAEIDSLYKTVGPIVGGTINGSSNLTFPWTQFDLQGKALSKSRTLIVKHTDGGGVYSYALYQILFPGPVL